MKCGSCSIEISKEFKVAIAKNTCPACGNAILASGNLAAFIPLCELLVAHLGHQLGVDEHGEALASEIFKNFNVSLKSSSATQQDKHVNNTIEIAEDDGQTVAVDEDGIKYEKIDKKKAQDIIQKMRDEALSGALADNGMELSDELLLTDDPVANAELMKQRQKQVQATNAVANGGSGGGFRRST